MSGQNDQVLLATAGYDHSIRFWQAHSGMCSRTINHPDGSINKLEITPDKQHIAAASYQHVKLYEIHTGHPNPVLDYEVPAPKNFTAVGFHADCKWMYTGSEDGTVRIWDFRSRATQCSRIFQVNSPVNCVCLHPNQAEMFIGDQSGALHTWDLRTDLNESMIPDLEASILSISIDPMGTLMAAVNNKGRCYMWTLTGGRRPGEQTVFRPKTRFPAHTRHILKCLFSPDSTLLATTSADQTCRIWRTADLSQMTVLKCEKQRWVWDCAFSGDSQYIITASSDNVARLWSVTGGDVKKEYIGHQRSIVCLAFRDENV